jgi:hypothetical protein
MGTRKKQFFKNANVMAEQRYFNNKFINEDTRYQLTPTGENGKFSIKAIEQGQPPRDLNDEEMKKLDNENEFEQEVALKKIKELLESYK